jgi:hypothetical protein
MGKHEKSNAVMVSGAGDPCPRCGTPMQIFAHALRHCDFYNSSGSFATSGRDPPRLVFGG